MLEKIFWRILQIGFILIAIFITYLGFYDASELTPVSYEGILFDKWHKNGDCDIIENIVICDEDEYGVIITTPTSIFKETVSPKKWSEIPTGSKVKFSFDIGKLGKTHNKTLVKIP